MDFQETLASLEKQPERAKTEFQTKMTETRGNHLWRPNPGPQTEAYFSKADILLFGGEAGPGKTDLVLGLAFEEHCRSLIMRRQYTEMGAMIERAVEINGTADGLNRAPPMKFRTANGRLIEFGAAAKLGDEMHWKGQPHDLLGLDEAVDFLERQVRMLIGWVRSTVKGQRQRIVLATNPPVTADGQYIISMFRPWLDITHPNPAQHGELRWFFTDPDGKDVEVDGPTPIEIDGKKYIPMSRTFIPGSLSDNIFLKDTGYESKLDSLPEPLRSAYRDGNFMAARVDAVNQVIPTMWVIEANNRWRDQIPPGIPMCGMGVDSSGGGADPMVLAPRYDGWYPELIEVPGKDIPRNSIGKYCAGVVVANRRDNCPIIIDMGGGYGGPTFEHLHENNIEVIGYKGAEKSVARTNDRQLGFFNKRSQALWQFREALDPNQDGGSPIALPTDALLMADLTAPTFEVMARGIKAETKEDIVKRLGRSPDRGDAVVISWQGGERRLMSGHFVNPRGRKPTVTTKRSMRGGRGRTRQNR